MSYFKATCPRCGEEYMTGVVGKKLMGYHLCHGDPVECEEQGCEEEAVMVVAPSGVLPVRDTSRVCSLHAEGKVAVSAFPSYAATRNREKERDE